MATQTGAAALQALGAVAGDSAPISSSARSDSYQGGVAIYPNNTFSSPFIVNGGGARGGAAQLNPGGLLYTSGGDQGAVSAGGLRLSTNTLMMIGFGAVAIWLILRRKK
jgi:hypothetical protein